MKVVKYLLLPLSLILLTIATILGYITKLCFGNHYYHYRFNQQLMELDSKKKRARSMTYFQHETSFNVVLSFCIISIIIYSAIYFLNNNLIIGFNCIKKSFYYHQLILYFKGILKYNSIALMLFLLLIVFYDVIVYKVLFFTHNFLVKIINVLFVK